MGLITQVPLNIAYADNVFSNNDLLKRSLSYIENYKKTFIIEKDASFNDNPLTNEFVDYYYNKYLSDFQRYNLSGYKLYGGREDITFMILYYSDQKDIEYANKHIKEYINTLRGDDVSKLEKAYIKITNDLYYNHWSKDSPDDKDLKKKERNVRQAIDNGGVVCHGYAALTDLYLKSLGFESSLYSGTTIDGEDHIWNGLKLPWLKPLGFLGTI